MDLLIVGLGNRLIGDDGAGPAVLDDLAARSLPNGLRLEEGGTDSLRLAALWRGERSVWLVDALQRGSAPGTVHRYDHDALLAIPDRHAGAHHLSLPENLRWLLLAEPSLHGVDFRLWGIEPARTDAAPGLSPPVQAAVARVADEIAELIDYSEPR